VTTRFVRLDVDEQADVELAAVELLGESLGRFGVDHRHLVPGLLRRSWASGCGST
jgi:hypothetical protein